ncbi:MAG TPA: hypothetical protein DCW29_09565 [Janthinobacterium sp.]|nr:hypothetical protein [Janthinobacterium sp.]
MWQQLIVFVIVAAAALHAAGKYLPAAWRERMVYFLVRRGAGQARMAAWFNTRASCGDGCSSCGSCADQAAPPVADVASARRVIKLHPHK